MLNEESAVVEVNKAFDGLEKRLGLNDKALDRFADSIAETINSSELLNKQFKGLGIENIDEKISNSKIGQLLNPGQ